LSLHSSTLSALLTDFKARYPMGAIVAEFLTIHQDSYVVRALAQSGGMTLASGMASAPAIEAAEDRAKIRALEALGIRVAPSFDLAVPPLVSEPSLVSELTSPAIAPPPLEPLPTSGAFSSGWKQDSAVQPPSLEPLPIADPLLSFPLADRSPALDPPVNATNYDFSLDSEATQFPLEPLPESLPELSPDPLPEPPPDPSASFLSEPPAAKPSKASKRKSEAAIAPPVAETPEEPATDLSKEPTKEPSDRSNEIAKISVEMKRLGWTTEQGRRHLKDTYGKRSRQELNDSELMDFLGYLESQPSSAQSLF
jgi:hypothetical protein